MSKILCNVDPLVYPVRSRSEITFKLLFLRIGETEPLPNVSYYAPVSSYTQNVLSVPMPITIMSISVWSPLSNTGI